ncbi:MAG: class II aldolase/adducin family protein [Bacteroidetes bacterium]|nr:class II aldolase/adducin family protein [Bacteroidota bacterium]
MGSVSEVRAELLELAHFLGDARQMAIFGEGNVSGKLDSGFFLVKASGTSLSTLTEDELVEVRARSLVDAVEDASPMIDEEANKLLLDSRQHSYALKPSVETMFHAWLLTLPGVAYVGHVHARAVSALMCSAHAEKFALHRLVPDQVVYTGPSSVIVPYVDPGIVLARHIAEAVRTYRTATGHVPKTILLKNHGIIALGGTAQEVAAALSMAEKAARIYLDAAVLGPPIFMEASEVVRIAGRSDEHYRQAMLSRIESPK